MCTNLLRTTMLIYFVDLGCSEKHGYVQKEVADYSNPILDCSLNLSANPAQRQGAEFPLHF